MEKAQTWEVSWYSREDRPNILAANQEEYGSADTAHASYFEWVVEKNPCGPPVFPVAREVDTQRVVGWALFTPFKIIWQGEEKKFLIGFNLMVRNEYRRMGVASRIVPFGLADGKRKGHQFMLGLANSKSTRVHQKLGDPIGATIPMVVRPMDIASLTNSFTKNSVLKWVIQLFWRLAERTICREKRKHNGKVKVEVKEESEIGVEFDDFWENVKGKYNLILVRNQAFLQWRFREMPLRSYQIFTARRNSELLGYIVLRIADIRGIRCGLISDLLVLPGKVGDIAGQHLMNVATQNFREAKVQLCGGLMLSHTQEYRIMRKAGYLRSPDIFAPQSITMVISPLLDDIPPRDILRAESWFISNADHDAV